VAPRLRNLKFRCTGCGNCCKEPLLPLTRGDLLRIIARTRDDSADIVRWVDRNGIEMDDEPEAFAKLRQGKRVMVLRHQRGRCRYLGADDRCSIYRSRPLGCRVFPFDPDFSARGALIRLRLNEEATECPYELDGSNRVDELRRLNQAYEAANAEHYEFVAAWNRLQRARTRKGKAAGTGAEFLAFLGAAPRPRRLPR